MFENLWFTPSLSPPYLTFVVKNVTKGQKCDDFERTLWFPMLDISTLYGLVSAFLDPEGSMEGICFKANFSFLDKIIIEKKNILFN
uniref:Uncharacterized protein n=1 Tax=Kalanchoe fedtschenkoi TaxID=63787 RepID=A0A7N0T2B6_KALFE